MEEEKKKKYVTLAPPPCTGVQLPVMLAWEGTGVWVLELTKDNIDVYNQLPPTNDVSVVR
jgi:hypothetical protein